MFLQKFKTPGIAHVAYLIGDGGDAAIIDPRRDVEEYLAAAQKNDLAIKYVIETHRQEDFVLGSAALAALPGVKVVSFDHPLFGHSDIRLRDGEELKLGRLKIRALHTPGHTPESTCYAVFTDDAPDRAVGVFSGDTLFVGEAGRTDLPDPKKTGDNAGALFDAVHAKLVPLGDQAMLWPAHGAGSVCGGNIADRDDSTLGVERGYNPVFTKTRAEFIDAKIKERIPRPQYFTHMEKVNFEGGMPAGKKATAIPLLTPKKLASEMKQGLVIDTRDPEAFSGAHIPGSVNIWLKGLPVFGGWLATETTRIYLVLAQMSDLETAVTPWRASESTASRVCWPRDSTRGATRGCRLPRWRRSTSASSAKSSRRRRCSTFGMTPSSRRMDTSLGLGICTWATSMRTSIESNRI